MMTDPNEALAEIDDALTSVKVAAEAVKKLSQEARSVSILSDDLDWCADRLLFYLSHMLEMAQSEARLYNLNADAEAKRQFEREA